MIETHTYTAADLEYGICASCGKESNEIIIGTDTCIDCYEAELFYQMSMCYNSNESDNDDEHRQLWNEYFR